MKVNSGPAGLLEAAKTAVSQYVYRPVMVGGEAAEVITTVEVAFVLQP